MEVGKAAGGDVTGAGLGVPAGAVVVGLVGAPVVGGGVAPPLDDGVGKKVGPTVGALLGANVGDADVGATTGMEVGSVSTVGAPTGAAEGGKDETYRSILVSVK